MTRTPQQWAYAIASLVIALAPLSFGVFRAWQTGDQRMFWMAFAATLAAQGVEIVARANLGAPRPLRQALVTLVLATAVAGGGAYLLGATAAPGIWAVAFVFGLCLAARSILEARSRPAPAA